MEHYILQNNAINVYQKYFQELEPAPPVEKSSCRTVNVYRDQNSVKRPISFLSWSADGGARLAATHCDLEFPLTPVEQCTHSYIWDIENPNKPQLTIIPHSPLCCLEFNPRDPNTLVGGLMNGQVAAFDIRRGSEPYESCPMDQSHCDPVRNVLHINSKTGTEFFSSSTDGQVKW
jgi:dynein intermediate chain 2, axonemal